MTIHFSTYISSIGVFMTLTLFMYAIVFWLCYYVFSDNGEHSTSIQSRKLIGYIVPFIVATMIWPFFMMLSSKVDNILFGSFMLLVVLSNFLYYPYLRFSHTLSSSDIDKFDNNFVLYLRSFKVDCDTELEKFINLSVETFIPMLAVGIPRKIFHKFVAYRLYLTNREWEKSVEKLAEKSLFIILRPNSTHGCEKEIEICHKYIALGRVAYLISSAEELESLKSHPVMHDYIVAINKVEQRYVSGKIILIRFTSKEFVEEFCIYSLNKSCQIDLSNYLQSFLNIKDRYENTITSRLLHGITALVFPLAYMDLYRWPVHIRIVVNAVLLFCATLIFYHVNTLIMLGGYIIVILVISLLAYNISTHRKKYLSTRQLNAALGYPWLIAIYFACITCACLLLINIFGDSFTFKVPRWMMNIEIMATLFVLLTLKKHYDLVKEFLVSNK